MRMLKRSGTVSDLGKSPRSDQGSSHQAKMPAPDSAPTDHTPLVKKKRYSYKLQRGWSYPLDKLHSREFRRFHRDNAESSKCTHSDFVRTLPEWTKRSDQDGATNVTIRRDSHTSMESIVLPADSAPLVRKSIPTPSWSAGQRGASPRAPSPRGSLMQPLSPRANLHRASSPGALLRGVSPRGSLQRAPSPRASLQGPASPRAPSPRASLQGPASPRGALHRAASPRGSLQRGPSPRGSINRDPSRSRLSFGELSSIEDPTASEGQKGSLEGSKVDLSPRDQRRSLEG